MKINSNLFLASTLLLGTGAFFFSNGRRSDYEEALSINLVHQEELLHNRELLTKVETHVEKVKERRIHQEAYRDSLQSVLNTCN